MTSRLEDGVTDRLDDPTGAATGETQEDVVVPQAENETGRRPSPTSRARRAAAAGVVNARRPSPEPVATDAAATTDRAASAEAAKAVAGASSPAAAPSAGRPKAARKPTAAKVETGRRVRPVVRYLLAAVVVVLIVVNVLLLTLPAPRSTSQADRDAVLSAAKTSTQLVISYDYHHVQADATKAEAHLTGGFATDYKKSIDGVIAAQAPKVKAVVQGQIDTAAIESVSGSGDQVTVIVFGEQKVTNSSLSQPRTDIVRLRVTMQRVGKDWKIAKLDQI